MEETTNLEQFAVEMVSFQEEVIKLQKDHDKGQIFDTTELGIEAADEDDVVEASCIKDIPGVALFNMGPVYTTAQVPYSFIDQYTAEVERVQFITFNGGHPIFSGLDVIEGGQVVGTWNDKVQAVGKEYLDSLTDFMTSQVLKREKKLFGITYQDAMLQDPILKHKHGISEDNLIRVRVFVPYSTKGRLMPYVDFKTGLMTFSVAPATQDMKNNLALVAKASQEVDNG